MPSTFLVPESETVDKNRREQTYPVLTDAEMARIKRFGLPMSFRDGEKLYAAGEASPGIYLLRKGRVAAVHSDRLGDKLAVALYEAGQFTGEIGQLSNGPALVDGVAQGRVEA